MDLTTAELGARLAAARLVAGISQAEVIRAAKEEGIPGLSAGMVSQIENGKREPHGRALRWLCDLYTVDLEVLIDPDYVPFSNARLAKQLEGLTTAVADLSQRIEGSPDPEAHNVRDTKAGRDTLDSVAKVRSGSAESSGPSQEDQRGKSR